MGTVLLMRSLRWALFLFCLTANEAPARGQLEQDSLNQRLLLSDRDGKLVLRLNYARGVLLDQVSLDGKQLVRPETGVHTGVKSGSQWYDSMGQAPTEVEIGSNAVIVRKISFGPLEAGISETWRFDLEPDRILWTIIRTYACAGQWEDIALPQWDFMDRSIWTGALLGNGGVAWTRLFDSTNSSYAAQVGAVTFWNRESGHGLSIIAKAPASHHVAVRFTRQPDETFSFVQSSTAKKRSPRLGLSRFRRKSQEIWGPVSAEPVTVTNQLILAAVNYDETYNRGTFPGLNGSSIRELCHTIARIGVIDECIVGSNGYYSDVAVLHEPWLAQMGLAIDDPAYGQTLSETLDFQRQHAFSSDGRIKSRWAGRPGDEMPGTYDTYGYYECQWGWLMDSQTSWVINVAEQFDFNGDWQWLRRQKSACEAALEYLLQRDSDGNGLVEMITDSHLDAKGSDWIDVVWAAYENALVNAQLFWALARWSDCEQLLGDLPKAKRYRALGARLQHSFNRPISEGGFWDAANQCYAYWRNKDGSVHGTNLVVPVNFSAIGYGLCTERNRRKMILDRIESLMCEEKLFFWPLCFFSFQKEEGHPEVNWPFPKYENGDLFLAWGELGTRCYALENPEVAFKYVHNVLSQYEQDGLAFQRYLRKTQAGCGKDILANNCSPVVGLYRNLYGVQPKFNRLYLEPHLTPELRGTHLRYHFRDKLYQLDLSPGDYLVSADRFKLREHGPFGAAVHGNTLEYFPGATSNSALGITLPPGPSLDLTIHTWPETVPGKRAWTESCAQKGVNASHALSGLEPKAQYHLQVNGARRLSLRTDRLGRATFNYKFATPKVNFELQPN